MKNILLFAGFCILNMKIAAIQTNQHGFYYYVGWQKETITLQSNKLAIQFFDHILFNTKRELLNDSLIVPITADDVLPAEMVYLKLKRNCSGEELELLKKRLERKSAIRHVGYVFSDNSNHTIMLQNRLVVKLKKPSDVGVLRQDAERLKITEMTNDPFDKNIYHFVVDKEATMDVLSLANLLHESGQYEFAEPDFAVLMNMHSTNDQHLGLQWWVRNTAQFNGCSKDADIDLFRAWGISTGSSTIKVAVIDDGVDLNHPDLVGNLLNGYCAMAFNTSNCTSNNGMHTGWPDRHGTPCAGLIAAVGNNVTGVAGVAYSCKIIPVVVGQKAPSQINSPVWFSTNTWAAHGIHWSALNGADVLSISWTMPSNNFVNSAIDIAYGSGRGGKGCLIFGSVGNDGLTQIGYPASNTKVMAVGATACTDNRAAFSNYHTDLDFVAPGINVYTTDRVDTFGYTKTGEKNYTYFGGTSGACPIAAGIGALVLSINPNLTVSEAKKILEQSCEKVGNYNYYNTSSRPTSTYNVEMGYGRLNAFFAAQLAGQSLFGITNSVYFRNLPKTSFCLGETFNFRFYNRGTFNTSNLFVVELSNQFGTFSSPTIIGISSTTDKTAIVNCTIPNSLPPSNTYRVRVRALNPNIPSAASDYISVGAKYCSLALSHGGFNNVCSGDSFNLTLSPIGGSIPIGTVFKVLLHNGTVLPPASANVVHTFKYTGNNVIRLAFPSGLPYSSNWLFQLHDVTSNILSFLCVPAISNGNSCNFCSTNPKLLTDNCGSFEDGSGGIHYLNNTDCSWLIQPVGAASITLSFNSFNLEPNDFLYVHDGPSVTSPLIGLYFGSSLPPTITGTKSSMLVRLKTNASVTAQGFSASYVRNTSAAAAFALSLLSVNSATGNACPDSKPKFSVTSTSTFCLPVKVFFELSDVSGSFGSITYTDSVMLSFNFINTEIFMQSIPAWVTPSPNYKVRVRNAAGTIISNALNFPIEPSCTYCTALAVKTAPVDTITDGSGSSNYVTGTLCSWKVDVSGAVKIDFIADTLRLGYNYMTGFGDTLWVYEGDTPIAAKLKQTLTGNVFGYSFNINSGKAFLKLKGILTGQGFSVSYKAHGIKPPLVPAKVCMVHGVDSIEVFNEIFGTFSSGSFVVELSDASGNFVSPVVIGNTTNLFNSFIKCSVNSILTSPSANYRVRVKHSSGLVSEPSSYFEIEELGTITPVVTPTTICPVGDSATVTLLGAYDAVIWPDGSSGSAYTAIAPRNYTFELSKGSCLAQLNFIVLGHTVPDITLTSTPALCNNTSTGEAHSVVLGNNPLSYEWSDGQTGVNATNLLAGWYYLTVTDANNCFEVASVEVREQEPLTATFTTVRPSIVGASDGIITAIPDGGVPPYSYHWQGGHTGSTLSGLGAGMYFITITDDNGCTALFRPKLFDPVNPGAAIIKSITCDSNNLRMGLFPAPVNKFNAIHFTPGENADGHVVEFSRFPTFSPVLDTAVVMGDSVLLLALVDSLEWGEGYYVRVQSFNSSGNGLYSPLCFISITPKLYWFSTGDESWHNPFNWRYDFDLIEGYVPNGCAFDVEISNNPFNTPHVTSSVTVGNLYIAPNHSIVLQNDLHICHDLHAGATLPFSKFSGTGKLIFGGNNPHIIHGKMEVDNLRIDNGIVSTSMLPSTEIEVNNFLELKSGTLDATAGTLRFKSPDENSSAMLDNFSPGFSGTLTGTVIAERGYAAATDPVLHKQHFFGTPISNMAVTQFAPAMGTNNVFVTPKPDCDEMQLASTSNYGNVFEYDESAVTNCHLEGWKVRSTGTVQTGKGYSVVKNGAGVLSVSGTPNMGNYSLSGLTNNGWTSMTTPQGNSYSSGWHLLGNPYLASLDLDFGVNGDFENAVQVLHTNGMFAGTYQPLIMSGSGVLAPFQGFMARKAVVGGTATFTFNASNRSRTTVAFQKNGEHQMSLIVRGNGFADVTYFNFDNNSTTGFDYDLDGGKLPSYSEQPTFYSIIGGTWSSINTNPDVASTPRIPLGFNAGKDGIFQFTGVGFDEIPNTTVYLEDKKQGVMHNLTALPEYTFATLKSDDNYRFVLHFKLDTPSFVKPMEETGLKIFSFENNVVVDYGNVKSQSPHSILIYDILGKVLSNENFVGKIYKKALDIAEPMYVIAKVNDGKTIVSKKLFLTP